MFYVILSLLFPKKANKRFRKLQYISKIPCFAAQNYKKNDKNYDWVHNAS